MLKGKLGLTELLKEEIAKDFRQLFRLRRTSL